MLYPDARNAFGERIEKMGLLNLAEAARNQSDLARKAEEHMRSPAAQSRPRRKPPTQGAAVRKPKPSVARSRSVR